VVIGYEWSELLDVEPAKYFVRRLKIPVLDYLDAIPPGLASRPMQHIEQLTLLRGLSDNYSVNSALL
jgi:hypothetical protein